MRNKIDYGIDLGTTNSAIARMENGIPTIIKADNSKDILPSCVRFTPKKTVMVGELAVSAMQAEMTRALSSFDEEKRNSFIEFKRTMGTNTPYPSSNMGRDFSSEELSAEVLKTLKSFVQEENLTSIVITVPAKFLNPQKEATVQAAKLAGFKQVELLQEPVAAATAYGLTAKEKDSYWMVFDFGGGTFDVALIKSEEGILTVKDTEGDNWLGGKNLDYAIVDQIIIPYLKDNYALDSIFCDENKQKILRDALKPHAEIAKNQLSFKNKWVISIELGLLPIKDDYDEEIEIDREITVEEMGNVLGPIFQKAIDITKELLKRKNLKGSELGALILVGGPTYSPILRRMLKEQITEKVDTSVDPMTVVAKGAALFASTISVSEEIKELSRDKTKLQLDIKYESTSVDLDEMVSIKVLKEKTTGIIPDKIEAEVFRGDGAWSSGKKRISEKSTLLEVILQEGCSNAFTVRVYDELGNQLDCQPYQFSILQGIAVDGMSVLPYHIGIGKWSESEEKEVFAPANGLEKNKKLPAIGVINGLKTTKTVRPGKVDDIIRIPIYQGDYNAEGTNPKLNNLINEVIISGESLPKLLPEESPVDITIKVDRSEQMFFSAYFPTIEHTEELKIEIKQADPPTEEYLIKEIAKAKQLAKSVNAYDCAEQIKSLETQLENEKGSADGKLKILDGLRKELFKLDEAQKATEWPNIERELKESFFELEDLIERIKENDDDGNLNMDKINAQIQEYRKKIDYIIKEKNTKEAKELTKEIGQMDFEIRNTVSGDAILVRYLHEINNDFHSFNWKDATKARQLVNQGMQFAVAGKNSEIRSILVQLISLMPENQIPVGLK